MHREHMRAALAQAKAALDLGEVPVGAAIVCDGQVIALAHNERETTLDPTAHAEILAIRAAGERLGTWRLSDCTLYVTLEPCPMCAGAIINSRISRVVFGAYDKKAGAFGSVMDMNAFPLNHKCEVSGGVLEEECALLLSDFFRDLRKKKKKDK